MQMDEEDASGLSKHDECIALAAKTIKIWRKSELALVYRKQVVALIKRIHLLILREQRENAALFSLLPTERRQEAVGGGGGGGGEAMEEG